LEVVGARLWHAADHHVGVTARLDLLQAMSIDESVQVCVQDVEEADQFDRTGVAGPLDDVVHTSLE
jgi:hypothetical protein